MRDPWEQLKEVDSVATGGGKMVTYLSVPILLFIHFVGYKNGAQRKY